MQQPSLAMQDSLADWLGRKKSLLFLNLKTKMVMKLKFSNCDKTQNSNCDETQKLNL